MDIHVIQAHWSEHREVLQHIREQVFIEEQNVPREIEWDGQDTTSTHFLAVTEFGQYIGCARLLPSGQIGRMAVLSEQRQSGIGAQLLQAVVEYGKSKGFDRLYLHAQRHAEAFYRKGGFLPFGEPFEEAGISHIAMEMKLPLAFSSVELPSKEPPVVRAQPVRPNLADTNQAPTTFSGYSECCEALLRVLQDARRRVLILHPYLDHELFDREDVVEALSELARSAPRVEIQILIYDSKPLVNRSHRVVELARRLDEKIKIRVLSDRPTTQSSSFVCADLDAYWLLPSYDNFDGVADLANPVTCRRLTEVFETAWSKSIEDPELRILRL